MEAHLLNQPQKKLQLNNKTTIFQNCQKIELVGSPATKELKKSHSSRQVGGKRHGDAEQAVPHQYVVDKNQEGHLKSKESQPHTRPPSPGFQFQEDKSHNFWLEKPVGVGAAEETVGFLSVSS